MNNFVIVQQTQPEWQSMWALLAAHPINADQPKPMECFNNGEVWQYMGTVVNKDALVHTFRHRSHPKSTKYLHLHITASQEFTELAQKQINY